MKRLLATSTLALCLAMNAAADTRMPAMVDAAISATESARTAFPFEYRLVTGRRDWRIAVAPGARPRLVSSAEARLSEGQREDLASVSDELRDVVWCATDRLRRTSQMRLTREDAETATYAFRPTSQSVSGEWAMRSDSARRFARHMRGEIVISKPEGDVIAVRFFTPGAVTPIPFVRIDAFRVTMQCSRAPNGRRYASRIDTDLHGVTFGTAFNQPSTEYFFIG